MARFVAGIEPKRPASCRKIIPANSRAGSFPSMIDAERSVPGSGYGARDR